MLFFALGLILIGLEIFVIPGFGIAGISGLLLVLGSLAFSMVRFIEPVGIEPGPVLPPDFFATLLPAFNKMVLSLVLGVAGSIAAFAVIPYAPVFRKGLILDESTTKEEGYEGVADHSDLIGKVGETISELRPGGTARFGGQVVDVTSDGGFLERGTTVKVVAVRGMEIEVAPVPENEA